MSEGATEVLPTPAPVSISAGDPLAIHWVVDADVRDWSTFRHPELGPKVLLGSFASRYDLRVGFGAASYFGLAPFIQTGLGLENAVARVQLRPLPIAEAIGEALPPDWSMSLSDKGSYALHTADLFQGVSNLVDALRDAKIRPLLDVFVSDSAANSLFLADTRRTYVSLADARELLGSDADEIVSHLYELGVFNRGHVLKCGRCRSASFYALSEQQQFTCRRYRTTHRAMRRNWLNDAEPIFRYEIAEVGYQFLRNEGHIPVLAAYDYFVQMLGARDRRPLDLGFEVEIRSPDGTLSEHDIVAAWGHDLWLGEATKQPTLGPKQPMRLRRLVLVAQTLSARGVLFATVDAFSQRTRQNIDSAFDAWPRAEVAIAEQVQINPRPTN